MVVNANSERFYTILNLFTGLITVVVQFAISFFLSPFLVNALGAEANGYSQLASNFVMYATLLATAFNSMASRFVSVAFHQGNKEKSKQLYSSIYVVNICLIALLLPISLWVTLNLEHVIVIENIGYTDVKLLFGCIFANFFLSLISSLYSISMYVKNAIFYSNILNCLKSICNAVLLLVLFSFLPVKVFYVSLASFFMGVVMLPVYIHYQRKLLSEVNFDYRYFSLSAVKELFLAGIWNSINQCGHLLLTGLDLLLSNWFVSPYAMGMIAVSKTIPSAIIQLGTTLNTNFLPSITKSWAESDNNAVLGELRMAIKISIVILSVPIVTFCCLGDKFYSLWQPTLDSDTLLVLSVLGCLQFIICAGTQVLYNVLTASNNLKVNSLTFVIMGIINVVVVYLGLKTFPQYGMYIIIGTSSILSIIRQIVVILPYIAKLLNQEWYTFYKDILITLLCCLVNWCISLAVVYVLPVSGWLTFIIDAAVISSITVLVEAVLLLSNTERKKIIHLIQKKR